MFCLLKLTFIPQKKKEVDFSTERNEFDFLIVSTSYPSVMV